MATELEALAWAAGRAGVSYGKTMKREIKAVSNLDTESSEDRRV